MTRRGAEKMKLWKVENREIEARGALSLRVKFKLKWNSAGQPLGAPPQIPILNWCG